MCTKLSHMQVNHLNRLEVTGQAEILASQYSDRGYMHISTYGASVCDTPCKRCIYAYMYKLIARRVMIPIANWLAVAECNGLWFVSF